LGSLQEANARLSNEVTELRIQTSELRKNVSSLSSQLSETLTEKQDLSRKFWDITEDCKELRGTLEKERVERESEEKERALLQDKINELGTELDAEHEKYKILLSEAKAQMQLDLQKLYEEKDAEMIAKVNDMQERIGGMEEALDLTRGELCTAEAERDSLIDRAQSLSTRLNKTSDIVSESQARIDQLESLNMTTSEMLRKKDEAFQRQMGEIVNLRTDLSSCRQQCDDSSKIAAAAKEEHVKVVQASQDEIHRLRADLSSFSSSKNLSDELIIELKKDIDTAKYENELEIQKLDRKCSDVEMLLEGSKERSASLQEELEKYVKKLEGERKERISLERNLSSVSKSLIQREESLRSVTGSLEEERNKLKSLAVRCSTLEGEKSDLVTTELALSTKLQQITEERDMWVADLQASQQLLVKVEQEYKDELSRCESVRCEVLKDHEKALSKQKKEIEESHSDEIKVLMRDNFNFLEKLKSDNRQLQNELSASKGEVSRMEEEAINAALQLRNQIDSTDKIRKELDDLEKRRLDELSSQQTKIDDMNEKLARAGSEVRRVLTKLEAANSELTKSAVQSNTLLNEKDRLESRLDDCEHETKRMAKEIATATKYASDLREENIRLAESLRSAKRAYSDLMQRLTTEARACDEKLRKELERLHESQAKLEQSSNLLVRKDANYAELKTKCKAAVDFISSELSHVSSKFEEERCRAQKEQIKLRSRIEELENLTQTVNSQHVSDKVELQREIEEKNQVIRKLQQDNDSMRLQLNRNKIDSEQLIGEVRDLRNHANDVEYRLELCQKRVLLVEDMNEEISNGDSSSQNASSFAEKNVSAIHVAAKLENDIMNDVMSDSAGTASAVADNDDVDREFAKWPCNSGNEEGVLCENPGHICLPSVPCTKDIDDVGCIMNKAAAFLNRKQRQLGVSLRTAETEICERKENVNINEVTLPKLNSM